MSPSAEEEGESDRGSLAEEDIPLFGGAGAGLRIEILLASPDEDAADPFVRLDDSGRFSTVVLGRVALGDGQALGHLAFKLQRTSYRRSEPGLIPAPTNRDIDALWERKRARLLEERSRETVVLHDLGEARFRQKPVTYCRETGRYFHPICPACTGFLRDCRDDALLEDRGLPAYSRSASRYLHCPRCAAAGGRVAFYAHAEHDGERPDDNAILRRREDLYRDMAAILDRDLSPADRARLERIFPCFSCGHARECRGSDATEGGREGGALLESRLAPLSFYEFHLLPLEALELHFDELCDFLGGMEWTEVRSIAAASPGGRGRDRLLEQLGTGSESHPGFLHEQDGSGLLEGEVLLLKLAAFAQLCRGLREHHARSRMPHLDLGPRSAMASLEPRGPDLPPRWGFQVKLVDPGAALLFRPHPGGDDPSGAMPVPPLDAPEEYQSPHARQAASREEPARLTLRSTDARGLDAEVASARGRPWDQRAGDAVRVIPRSGPLEDRVLWGLVTGRAGGGLSLRLECVPAPPAMKLPSAVDANVAFYTKLGAPCDLHPLGMLLFRALLVNDEQDFYSVTEALGRILAKVKDAALGSRDPERIRGLLDWQLEAEAAVFDPAAVLYPRSLRRKTGKPSRGEEGGEPGTIPPGLWADVLVLGLRLITSHAGFSYAAHASDWDPERPGALLDRVLADVEALSRRVRVEVFGASGRDRAIARACDALIAEVAGGEAIEATVRLARPLPGKPRP